MNKREEIQKSAKDKWMETKCGTLAISGGVGKTKIALDIIYGLFWDISPGGTPRILVVAPKLSIFQSWKDDIKKFNHNIQPTYSTYISLENNVLDYDLVILDEITSIKEHHSEWLRSYGGPLLGLTGTPPKHKNSEKGKMLDEFCPVVFTYVTDDAVGDEILNDYRIIVHELAPGSDKVIEKKTKGGGKFYTSEKASIKYYADPLAKAIKAKEHGWELLNKYNDPECNDLFWCNMSDKEKTELRNDLFASINIASKEIAALSLKLMSAMMQCPTKEAYAKELLSITEDKCIVFANSTMQADRLCPESYHTKNKNSAYNLERFKTGDYMVLSSVMMLEMGVTIADLKVGIVLHAFGSNIRLAQRFFRLLRLRPDEVATLHILVFEGTKDAQWTTKALEGLNQDKITWIKGDDYLTKNKAA